MISQLERGGCKYSQTSLEKIAKALDVRPSQLLDRDPAKAWDFTGNAKFDALNRRLTPQLQEQLIELLSNQCDAVLVSAEKILIVEAKIPERLKPSITIKKRPPKTKR